MPRKIVKRLIPDPDWIKKQKSLQLLGNWVNDPSIWHLNRYSVSTAVFIGLFVAFIPLPIQMLLAAVISILCRAHLAVAILVVWVSNPLTMPPLFYLAFKVGSAVMGISPQGFSFELSWQWVNQGLTLIWQPFLLGCFLCGLFFGLLGAAVVRVAWRHYTIKLWRERRLKRERKHR